MAALIRLYIGWHDFFNIFFKPMRGHTVYAAMYLQIEYSKSFIETFFLFTYRHCVENLTLLILLNTFLLHKKVLLHIDYVKLDCVTYF